MREQSAKILAAEIEHNRHWRVDKVFPHLYEDGVTEWIVRLRHRVRPCATWSLIGEPEEATEMILGIQEAGRRYCDQPWQDGWQVGCRQDGCHGDGTCNVPGEEAAS